jgi:hypothetical protein
MKALVIVLPSSPLFMADPLPLIKLVIMEEIQV